MAQRFGRNRKRRLEGRIRDLERIAFGPYGPCPTDIASIDNLPYERKETRATDDPRRHYELDVQLDVIVFDSRIMNRLTKIVTDRDVVRLDERALMPTNISMQHNRHLPIATLSFTQVHPGRSYLVRPR